ncbi:hypothetical protein VFPBJ_01399 [Purpureocillium lilacinum]|uniref:Uncharacterized protein n=1 Tax=Purpureocillium lilacinum TaxID=33203 RepID=A0A179HD14_PURLI|nr:hypothetical protein VFPBJ_01399 [Purpureocillium lilacinum]
MRGSDVKGTKELQDMSDETEQPCLRRPIGVLQRSESLAHRILIPTSTPKKERHRKD